MISFPPPPLSFVSLEKKKWISEKVCSKSKVKVSTLHYMMMIIIKNIIITILPIDDDDSDDDDDAVFGSPSPGFFWR